MPETTPAPRIPPPPAPRRRPVIWGLGAAVVCLLVLGSHLVRMGGDVSGLAAFGELHVPPLWSDPRLPESTVVHRASVGYDGQYYLIMALAPFENDPRVPTFRRQRILYPLAAWLLAFGRAEVAAHALALISLLSVAVTTGLMANLAASHRQSPAWGMVGGLSAGALLACQYLCPDALLIAFLAGTVWALDRRRLGWAGVFLGAAILTKETALILWLALAVGTIVARTSKRMWPVLLAPVPWVAWVVLLHQQTGQWTFLWDLEHQRTVPLAGWLGALAGVIDSETALRNAVGPLACALLLPVMAWIALGARGERQQVIAGALLLWCLSALLWGEAVWSPFVACARNLAPLVLLAAVLAADTRRRGRLIFAALALGLALLTVMRAVELGVVPEITTVGDLTP